MTADARPVAPARWQEAVIERMAPQTPRIVSVFLRALLAPHLAGQHIDVRLTAPDGYRAQRSYSIASAPGSANLELAIERLDDGEISPYFHEVARPGDAFEIRGPIGGHFVWSATLRGYQPEIRWPSTPKKCRCPGSGCRRTRLPFSGTRRPSARATTG